MRLLELLLGRPLRSDEEAVERIGVLTAIPVLGLDALASASYGPEAALTVLLPLGATATIWVRPITLAIVAVLTVVALSYAQTIPAYPNGGGSFTVAKENLGRTPGLLAAAALCTDYVLNVAVAISAGIGAICSAERACSPIRFRSAWASWRCSRSSTWEAFASRGSPSCSPPICSSPRCSSRSGSASGRRWWRTAIRRRSCRHPGCRRRWPQRACGSRCGPSPAAAPP